MIRKSFVLGLLLACLPALSQAKGDRKPLQVYDFSKGVDTYHDPKTLPDGFAQDSLNVLFDDRAPITKRFGYAVAWSTKSYSYTGLWTYTDSSNVTWQIARSSDQLTASDLAGHVVKIATVSVNNLVGEANAFGNAYFVDQTQGVYYWNGSSTTFLIGSPKGSILAQFHNRLWVTGLAVPNGNQLYGSGYYGSNWTTGLNATDPVQYSVGLQDNFDNVTAEYVYLDTLYLFKHYAIYALYGFDQTNFQISQLTQECGCIDGASIQTYNGGLKFVSLRGVEDFNGYSCKRISDPVKNKLDPAIQLGGFSQQSWIQDSQSDFSAGTAYDTSTDTAAVAGSVLLSGYADTFSSLSNWTINAGGFTVNASGVVSNTSVLSTSSMTITNAFPLIKNTFYASFKYNFVNQAAGTVDVAMGISNNSGNGYVIDGVNSTPNNLTIYRCINVFNNCTSLASGTGAIINDDIHTAQLYRSATGFMQLSLDGAIVASATDATYSSFTKIHLLHQKNSVGADQAQFRTTQIYASSGSYKSQIHNFGTINAWGNLSVGQVLNDGTIAYSMCSSTSSVMATPTSCASISPNAQITISTGVPGTSTYGQFYATFTITAATHTPTLQSVAVQSFTGSLQVPMASTIWDNRYWLALTTNTSNTANDTVLVLNSRGGWSVFDIHAGAFTQYKGSLYHSDSAASGNIYLDNQAYADNGAAINSFVRTKNLSVGGLASDDYFYAAYPSAANTGSCAMSVAYNVESSTNAYSLGSPTLSEFQSQSAVKLPFPVDSSHQDFAGSVDFSIGTNDNSCAFKFYGLELLYRSRPIQ